jgi:vancomycin resistance protein YoaR
MEEKTWLRLIGEWLLALVAIFLMVLFVGGLGYIVMERIYSHEIYPHVYLGEIHLGGLSPEAAKEVLNQRINQFYENGVNFYFREHYTTIYPTIASAETDLAYEIISFNAEETVARAFLFGRGVSWTENLIAKARALLFGHQIDLVYQLKPDELLKVVKENFSAYEQPAIEARLDYNRGAFSVIGERAGVVIDYEPAVAELDHQLRALKPAPITLKAGDISSRLIKSEVEKYKTAANDALAIAPLQLESAKKTWTINKDRLGSWLKVKAQPPGDKSGRIYLGIDSALFNQYIASTVAPVINEEPIDAKFEIKDGRVAEFQASQDGLIIDEATTLKRFEDAIRLSTTTVDISLKNVPSQTKTQDVNGLGIKEVIGVGQSNFAGSPVNRRHNIKNGATALHGLLIKPAEEFSLVKALGEIEAKTGYLPELVIKGNKTIPEYGGGLCQIGTTMFRSALSTGLPITERRNHSYRVTYYEPAGTDATIYNPKPDLRFINDTGHHVLIQSRIEGDNLYFDFWGTPDGRVATRTTPVIYNFVKPGPTNYIETLDLKPGEKKCTEKPHTGADTYFDYIVTYLNGQVMEKRFKSHYIPWREVCLIGVEKLSSPADQEAATSSVPLNL